ncbi:MAG: ABC transporter ATP-binding protein [Acidimicrobiales bacterium]
MIEFEGVTVTYPGASEPVLRHVDLSLPEGELVLVVGRTGAGKSTLLGAVNGSVPHFTGGRLRGRVSVAGRDTRTHPPRELADVVGMVGQDPLAGFVTDFVEEELAYGMEQLGVPADVMRRRVEETLDLLGIADLRDRPLRTLSGGQQQRVAIGAVLAAHPAVLVLDEPTSALDPTAAEEVLANITRLVHDLGTTVLLAEHRLERVVQYADRLVEVLPDGSVRDGSPVDLMADAAVAPPVVSLGRLAGWTPLPLSVRDARRMAEPLRRRLPEVPPDGSRSAASRADRAKVGQGIPLLSAQRIVVRHGAVVAVRGVTLDLRAGEVAAIMGRNGAGKSSLLWAMQGQGPRQGGIVRVAGQDPARLAPSQARRLVGLVPQDPSDLLYLETVAAECAQGDSDALEAVTRRRRKASGSPLPTGTTRRLLDRFAPGVPDEAHPHDLSEGQRLALALAVQLAPEPRVVLLDEPTRGLDYPAKAALVEVVRSLAADGRSVLVATHDVEFAAAAADRVVVLAAGEVVADGPTAEVVTSSPAFAPQTAKILAPLPYLTVDQVACGLAVGAAS